MGSKGTQTTTNTAGNTAQTYTANPYVQSAANTAISGAQQASQQPFQMPVAPVAGFSPLQQQAFQQYQQLQGVAQPYINTAAGYTNQSAAPITAEDVNQYYNPMAANVTAQLKNIYGEQNVQNQGNLTAQAGGVGADRIAVGMADLANQQGLASGQIYSQLYQQALQAAEQQKQMEAGAGSAFAGYGNEALQTGLQGTGALSAAGLQQQQQTQAELNAPYQNRLAQIAYQFQTPQYLAGIAGGLAPALGGTTVGNQYTNQVTTPPQPSIANQLIGLGTAGAGLYGALGSGSGGVGSAQNPLVTGTPGPTLTAADYQGYGPGGNWTTPFGFARGGPVAHLAGGMGMFTGGGSFYPYADGGATDDTGPAIPGAHVPKAGGLTPVPLVSLPAGAGHSGLFYGQGINMSTPAAPQQQQPSETIGGDLAGVAKLAATVIPFLKAGGKVDNYDDGGEITPNLPGPNFDPSRPINAPAPFSWPWPFNKARTVMGGQGEMVPYDGSQVSTPKSDRLPLYNPNANKVPLPRPYPGPGALGQEHPGAFRLDKPAKSDDDEESPSVNVGTYTGTSPAAVAASMQPASQQPYPDALERDTGQNLVRSPWLSLIKAGATIASTPGNIGTAIGKGILAGTGTLETQRKELRSEQELNDKAEQLYQTAQQHLDKYNKMTPYEQASIAVRNRELDQADEVGGGKPITEMDIARVIDRMRNGIASEYTTMPYPQLREAAIQAIRAARGQQTTSRAGPGSDASTALPDPGEGKREAGKWYIGPTGKPQPWNG